VGTTRFISNLARSSGSLPPSLLWLETDILSRMSQEAIWPSFVHRLVSASGRKAQRQPGIHRPTELV
jgi:hypothetical protein